MREGIERVMQCWASWYLWQTVAAGGRLVLDQCDLTLILAQAEAKA